MQSPQAPAFSLISVLEDAGAEEERQIANEAFSDNAVASISQNGYPGQFHCIGVEEDLINGNSHPSLLTIS